MKGLDNMNNLPKNSKGEKLYPIGYWENTEHKLETQNNKLYNKYSDLLTDFKSREENKELIKKIGEKISELNKAIEEVTIIGYMAYLPYNLYKVAKEQVIVYNLEHNIRGYK